MAIRLKELNTLWGNPSSEGICDLELFIGEVCTDSRKINQGSFFVPLVGVNFNAHDFLEQAFERGAQAAVISKSWTGPVPAGLIYWRVNDTLEAYQQIASLHRSQFSPPVICVTGSVGKTTTRELIRSILQLKGPVLASIQNNNNDVGVPLTLLQLNSSHTSVVIEMGMRGLGEIKRLSACALPDIAVITNIGNAHLGLLGSKENIAKAKCEIVSSLNPSGVVIIPSGDSLLEDTLRQSWRGRLIKVDVKNAKSQIDEVHSSNYMGIVNTNDWSLEFKGKKFCMPLEGMHNAKNFMFALAIALELNVPLGKLNRLSIDMPSGRNSNISFGGLTVLDETYNASPESVQAALNLLSTKSGRHFAVLGTMLELGDNSLEFHRQVVQHAVELCLDGLIIVSEELEAKEINSIGKNIPLFSLVTKAKDAEKLLKEWLKPGDVLLLKGSREMRLECLLPALQELI